MFQFSRSLRHKGSKCFSRVWSFLLILWLKFTARIDRIEVVMLARPPELLVQFFPTRSRMIRHIVRDYASAQHFFLTLSNGAMLSLSAGPQTIWLLHICSFSSPLTAFLLSKGQRQWRFFSILFFCFICSNRVTRDASGLADWANWTWL